MPIFVAPHPRPHVSPLKRGGRTRRKSGNNFGETTEEIEEIKEEEIMALSVNISKTVCWKGEETIATLVAVSKDLSVWAIEGLLDFNQDLSNKKSTWDGKYYWYMKADLQKLVLDLGGVSASIRREGGFTILFVEREGDGVYSDIKI